MKLQLYPPSDHGLVYVALATIPAVGAFAALLFYEWFGNTSILADTTMVASKYAAVYSIAVVGWKIHRLRQLRKRDFAKSRLKIFFKALAVNVVIIGGYLGERFFFG